MKVNPTAYRHKRVLITGGLGFIGSNHSERQFAPHAAAKGTKHGDRKDGENRLKSGFLLRDHRADKLRFQARDEDAKGFEGIGVHLREAVLNFAQRVAGRTHQVGVVANGAGKNLEVLMRLRAGGAEAQNPDVRLDICRVVRAGV